jgi:hypothetical protein
MFPIESFIHAVCEGEGAGGLKQFQEGVLYESAVGRQKRDAGRAEV